MPLPNRGLQRIDPPTWHVALISILYVWQFAAALFVDYVVISLEFMGLGFGPNWKIDGVFALLLSLILVTIGIEVSMVSNDRLRPKGYLAFQLWKGACITALCIMALLEIATMSFLDLFYWLTYTGIYIAPFYLAFFYAVFKVYQPARTQVIEETGLLDEFEIFDSGPEGDSTPRGSEETLR